MMIENNMKQIEIIINRLRKDNLGLFADIIERFILEFEHLSHSLSVANEINADLTRQLGEKDEGWISVEDSLPESSGYYLAYRPDAPEGNKTITILYAHHNNTKWSGRYDVTHWMPLPSPPTEQNGEEL